MGLFTKKKANTIANACINNVNEQSIPLSVANLVQYVEQNALNLEGIYRISGPTKEIDALCDLMIKAKPIDFSKYTHYTIAGALKKYFVQFDEPIIPFNCYESFLQIARKMATAPKTPSNNTNSNNNHILLSQSFAALSTASKTAPSTSTTEFGSKKERVQEFRELLKTIPEQNYKVLKYVLKHLTKVELNSSANKMSSNNLAIVFGPIFFRYKESSKNKDPMKILTDAPAISSCVHTLITDFEYIFEGKQILDESAPNSPIEALREEAVMEARKSKRSSVGTPQMSRNVSSDRLAEEESSPSVGTTTPTSRKKSRLSINIFAAATRNSRTNSRASCSMADLPKLLSQQADDIDSKVNSNNGSAANVFDKLVAVEAQRQ